MSNKAIQVEMTLKSDSIVGKSDAAIREFLTKKVLPLLIDGLTTRTKEGEAGCSVHSDGTGECHISIRF